MLGSPWTMSLCALLKAALGDVDEQDPFAVVLRDRLKKCGTELLDQVGIESPLRLSRWDLRLIMFAKIARAIGSEGSSTSPGTKKVCGIAGMIRPRLIVYQTAKTWRTDAIDFLQVRW